MNIVSIEVNNLQQNVEEMRKSNGDEANKISDSLQNITDEIQKFMKRVTDIESRMEAERKEQLEKNETFSCEISNISDDLRKIEIRQDTNEGKVASLDENVGNLGTTVSSIQDRQVTFNSRVGTLEKKQNQLDSRVKALEDNFDPSDNTNAFQVPSRNPCFCGRNVELRVIAGQLKNTENSCAHAAICGLGGVGKTSLAVEFLWRQRKEYPGGIFWISGENNNLFEISLSEMARQIGTFEKDFSNLLSRTLQWLRRRDKLWCLIIDNLDELEMSANMRKLVTGHWKQEARGHIIITTRREPTELEEETGIEEACCVELKCLTEDEGLQFLRTRTGKTDGEDGEICELVRELGGLPLALDQAAAYIRWVRQPVKVYLKKYREQKVLLLKKKKARHFVENTSPDRLAVHTTWQLNFDYIKRISEEMDLGRTPTLVMQVSAFLGPDDIPFEVINESILKGDSSNTISGLLEQAEIVSLLTKFSLFQRYGINSFSVHRLVQEVIRTRMEKEQKESVLSCAIQVLHHALASTRSPAAVCESFGEDAVFSVENPPSLHLWGKLASHATYLQNHLRKFSLNHGESVRKLLHTEETVRVFNEAAVFCGVSQQKIKAQEIQELKLDFLVHLEESASKEDSKVPNYFVDIPLKDRDYKLISYCMRHSPQENDAKAKADSQKRTEEKQINSENKETVQ